MNHDQTQCPECKGNLEQQTVTHDLRFRGSLYSFQDVPARVCGSCGVAYLDAETLKQIENVLKKQLKPKVYAQVPVFSLESLSRA